jgi:response regulator RpfG family c-di-GMP phosphodiesterase
MKECPSKPVNAKEDKAMRILLVEDNRADARLIQERLKRAGHAQFELVHAVRLYEALQQLEEGVFDVVLLDLGLPESQGIDTFHRVHEQAPSVPIVMLSGLADEALAIETVRQGAQDYLVKGQVDGNILLRSMRYAIERKRLEQRIALFSELTRVISSSLDINEIYEIVISGIKELVDFDQATITLVEEGTLRFLAVSSSVETVLVEDTVLPLAGTPTEWVMANKATNFEADFAECMQFPFDEIHFSEGMRSAIRLPLIFKGWVFGTFNLNSHNPNAFGQGEQEILEELVGQIAPAIKNDRLFTEAKRRMETLESAYRQLADKAGALAKQREKLDDALLNMARILISTQEASDPYTSGHSERVAELCQSVASKMGLSRKEMRQLQAAALLHDLGRVNIPKEILFKPGALTANEKDEVRQHLTAAAEMLRPSASLNGALPVIESQKERYGGGGYPKNLKGEEIPIGARILAVADAYDAMTSDRPHRPAMTEEEATETIKKESGAQWDPEVVDVFCGVVSKVMA